MLKLFRLVALSLLVSLASVSASFAQYPPVVYGQVTHLGHDYSWARESGTISMRVERHPNFWRFNCPQKLGHPMHVFINDAGGNFYDLIYDAGQLLPRQVSAFSSTGLYRDYSADAEKYKLTDEMRTRACPNGW
ncbi:hypothetical protein K8Q93_03640 [Candidatus Parcubacteria bacterium]|nr:hypothetical protein [Candidatus Parcubacteria bacterium]